MKEEQIYERNQRPKKNCLRKPINFKKRIYIHEIIIYIQFRWKVKQNYIRCRERKNKSKNT